MDKKHAKLQSAFWAGWIKDLQNVFLELEKCIWLCGALISRPWGMDRSCEIHFWGLEKCFWLCGSTKCVCWGVDKGPATCVVGCWKPHNCLWVALVPRPWGTDTGPAKYGGMIKDVQECFWWGLENTYLSLWGPLI